MIPLVDLEEDRTGRKPLLDIVGSTLGILALVVCSTFMFRFTLESEFFPIVLHFSANQVTDLLNRYLYLIILWGFVAVVGSMGIDMIQSWRLDNARLVPIRASIGVLTIFFLTMSAIPMIFSLTSDRQALTKYTPKAVIDNYIKYGQEFTSSYGLFRSMTGVGNDFHDVRVPTLLVQVATNNTSTHPLKFRYYAGDTNSSLTFVLPHQPRLDWQMWFLALSPHRIAHEKWFQLFCKKLFQGERSVWSLLGSMDDPTLPKRILSIQVEYTQFDFTKFPNSGMYYWQRLPDGGKHIVFNMKRNNIAYLPPTETPLVRIWLDYGLLMPFTIIVLFGTFSVFKS